LRFFEENISYNRKVNRLSHTDPGEGPYQRTRPYHNVAFNQDGDGVRLASGAGNKDFVIKKFSLLQSMSPTTP